MARKQKAGKSNKKLSRSGRNQSKGKYTKQRIRTTENKNRRRKKHLLKHPNDLQCVNSLGVSAPGTLVKWDNVCFASRY